MSDTEDMTIGEMAEKFKVSLRLLRFYEDKGLLEPRRIQSMAEFGPRIYPVQQRRRMDVIREFTNAGVRLSAIAKFISACPEIDYRPSKDLWSEKTKSVALSILAETNNRLKADRLKVETALANNVKYRESFN